MKNDFFPIILGSDENAYGTARLFYEKYGIKPLMLCTRALVPTCFSNILKIKRIEGFDSEEIFSKELRAVLEELKGDYEKLIVIPCSDYYTELLVNTYDQYSGMIANRFISKELLSKVGTKDEFYKLCDEYGLDYPKTVICRPEERVSVIDRLGFDFPIVVKPENSNAVEYLHCRFEGKKKTYFFKSKEEYLGVISEMNKTDYKGLLIIQEFIVGDDTAMRVMNSYSDKNGKVRFMCLGRPLLEEYAPNMLGNYAAIMTEYDKALYEKIQSFLEKIGYVGFSNIDIKFDRRTGRYMLFELNPRLGRSSFFLYAAGYNAMEYLIDDVVYSKTGAAVYADREAIWSSVPGSIIKKYVKEPELNKKATRLIKEKGLCHTLSFKGDNSLKRRLHIARYYLGQERSFKKYYFDKDFK